MSSGELLGIAAVVVVVGGSLIAHLKVVQSWYDMHTTAKERLVVDEFARVGLAAAEKVIPALDGRLTALEATVAGLQAAASTVPASAPAARPAPETPAPVDTPKGA